MTATIIGLSAISIIVVLVAYGSCKAASKSDIEIEKIIKNVNYQSNEQLIKDYNEKRLIEELEEVELIIEYEKE